MRRDPFQAIADPTRRKIIELVSVQPRSLGQIAEYFDISRPAISKQIKILEECGMIRVQQQGRERWCYMEFSTLKEVANWVMKYELYWIESVSRM